MDRKNLGKTGLLIFCFGLIITGVGVGTGVMAREHQKLVESQAQEQKQKDKTPSLEAEKIDILSSFETTAKSEASRDQNLKTACEKLNGVEVAPGAILSFNETVGPYTEAVGYLPGPSIIREGEMGEELGGGVCQVSTTLYNAALQGNLGIVERHRHSFPMDYVEVGLDAMINAPDSDLKIQNTTERPLFIEAFAKEGTVVIQFHGTRSEDGVEVQIESSVLNTTEPEGEEVRLSTELEAGSRQVLQESRNGYETRVYRRVYRDGELVSEEVLSEDTYPPVRRIVIEGYQQSK